MTLKHTIYVASSWRNEQQAHVVALLRKEGHEVYDFKNPAPDDNGFSWRQISAKPTEDWTPSDLKEVLQHPVAKRGHGLDQGGMSRATACVLLLPCGSSAHLEAGWCAGRGIPTIAYAPTTIREPELMYLTFGESPIVTSESDLLLWIQSQPAHAPSCAKTLRDALVKVVGSDDPAELAEMRAALQELKQAGDGVDPGALDAIDALIATRPAHPKPDDGEEPTR